MDMEVLVANDPVELSQDQLDRVVPLETIKVSDIKDRFTVRVDTYWEHYGDEPVSNQVLSCVTLETCGVEPYVRKFKITEREVELNLGDLSRHDVGYILVYNLEGTKLLSNPTSEELEEVNKHIAVINGFEILPRGMPFLARPSQDLKLLVKSLYGQTTLQVCIYPR